MKSKPVRQALTNAVNRAIANGSPVIVEQRPKIAKGGILSFANQGGKEMIAQFVRYDGEHRLIVSTFDGSEDVSISRCQVILGKDSI